MKNLQIIAFSIDLARQKEQPKFVKSQMDFCRINGYNTIILYLEAAVRTSVTSFFDKESSYSLDELKDMVDYGESIGLDIIPAFETLAHMEKFFIYDELSELSEFNDEQTEGRGFCSPEYPRGSHGCVTNPHLQDFTDGYVTEVCKVFRSKYVHMGMDEMFEFACCDRCQKIIGEGVSKQKLFVDFVLHARDLVANMGCTMMIWDDMLEYYDVAEDLPRDIVLCNWNYIFVGNSPRGKWTGRSGINPFDKYECLDFKYLFCCKAGNISQTFNVDSFTKYAKKYNPLGAMLTSWERSDCFYPCLQPIIAYAGRKWSGLLQDKTATEVFAGFLDGNIDLAQIVIDLYAPDFTFCRTDVTNVAEANNHVIAAYIARLRGALKIFERADFENSIAKNDVFADLYANIALQYAQLSLAALGNEIFDEYECGGVKSAASYNQTIFRAERLFSFVKENGERLWAKYRTGIKSYGNAWQNFCLSNQELLRKIRSDLNAVEGKMRGVLYVDLMLPDTYSSIFGEISVRYVGDERERLIYCGGTKTMLTTFDTSGEYELRFATEPKPVESVTFSAFGEGEQFPVYFRHFDGQKLHMPADVQVTSGKVENEKNVLKNDYSFVSLGYGSGLEHLNNLDLSKVKNTIRVIFKQK